MNATEQRLRDALKTVGDTIGPEDVPEPRFAGRRRRLSRPAMAAAVAASAAVVGGAVLGGALSSGSSGSSGDERGPLAPPSAAPSPSGSTAPKVSVFLCVKTSANPTCEHKDATEPQKRAIRSRLEALPQVRVVEFENTAQTPERVERRFRSSPQLSRMLKSGDIPESFRVTLAPGGDGRMVMRHMLGSPGVDLAIIEGR